MSKEKQIEEMWNIITTDCDGECDKCEFENDHWCFTRFVINKLYNAGYRKQSENVIEFPCKLGDKVYSITECSCEDIDGVHTECEFYGYGIDDRICNIPNGAKCPYQYRIIEFNVMEMNIFMFKKYWGKTVFPTREEAEAKMKGGAE